MERGQEGMAWVLASSGWGAGTGESPHDRYFFGTAQRIPDWLINFTFLVKPGM